MEPNECVKCLLAHKGVAIGIEPRRDLEYPRIVQVAQAAQSKPSHLFRVVLEKNKQSRSSISAPDRRERVHHGEACGAIQLNIQTVFELRRGSSPLRLSESCGSPGPHAHIGRL